MTSTHPNRFSIAGYDGTAVLLMACSVYAVAAAVALVGFDLPTAARIPLALPLVLFVPGYGVVSALFPPVDFPERLAGVGREDRHPAFGFATAERGVLSVIASIVVVPAVALAANPVTGIELTPVLAGVAGVTVVSSAVAVLRIRGARNGLARPDGRSGLRAIGVAKPARDSLTFVTAVLVAVLLFSSVAVSLTGPTATAPDTEFYVANPGEAPGTGVATDDAFSLRIAHDRDESQRYTLVVAHAGGPDAGAGDGSAGNLTEAARETRTVRAGTTARVSYAANATALADAEAVAFLLYTGSAPDDPSPSTAHRSLRVSVAGSDE